MGGVALLLAFVVWLSHRSGTPSDLPEVALDWRLLFHFERAATLMGTIGVVLLVGWRTVRGDFPSKVGQLKYRVGQTAADALAITDDLEARIRSLELLSHTAAEPPRRDDRS